MLAGKKGIIAVLIFSMGDSEIMDAANRQQPTGGVARPVMRLILIKRPAWSGSIV